MTIFGNLMPMPSKRPHTPEPVRRRICELLDRDMTAAEIHRQLEADAGPDGRVGKYGFRDTEVPTVRTVQNIVRPLRPPDDSGRWSVADAEPGEIPLILPVLGHVLMLTGGRRGHVTRREARLILRVRAALPRANPSFVWSAVRDYARRKADDTADLDAWLALNATTPEGIDYVLEPGDEVDAEKAKAVRARDVALAAYRRARERHWRRRLTSFAFLETAVYLHRLREAGLVSDSERRWRASQLEARVRELEAGQREQVE